MMRALWMGGLLAMAACGDAYVQPPLSAVAATTLSGTVTLLEPVEGAEVCAYRWGRDGRSTTAMGCGVSDAHGDWQLRAGTLIGPIVVEARGATLTSPLTAVEHRVPQFAFVSPIHLSPIGHLTAAYAEALVGQGRAEPAHAVQQARVEMNRHFGAMPHHLTRPWVPPEAALSSKSLVITEAVQAHIYAAGLDTLARQWSATAGIAEDTTVTLQTVLQMLAEDVRADGIFDGVGNGGATLQQRDIPLTGGALRYDLAVAMSQFLRSERNQTALTPIDFAVQLKAVAASEGAMFEGAGANFSDQKPKLSSCHVIRQDGQMSSLDHPQRGLIEVVCTWEDAAGIREASIRLGSAYTEESVTALGLKDGVVSVLVDTHELLGPIDFGRKTVDLFLTAANVLGFEEHTRVAIYVDESAPVLALKSQPGPWLHPGETLRVVGDLDRPIKNACLEPYGIGAESFDAVTSSFFYEDNVRHFDLTFPLQPVAGQVATLRLVLLDWVGNQTIQMIEASNDITPPLLHFLPSFFRQEFSQSIVDMGTTAPVVLEKLYNTLDYLPDEGRTAAAQNLPVLMFSATDQDDGRIGTALESIKVEYSYVLADSLQYRRDWTAIQPDESGVYRLPIAYQTLLPESQQSAATNFVARCKPQDLHHIIIRATDLAGNVATHHFDFYLHLKAPPIEIGSCAPTGALMGAGLAPPNFRWVFQNQFDLFDSRMVYQLDLPERSLAPWSPAQVALRVAPLQSHIGKLTERWSEIATGSLNERLIWHRRPEIQQELDAAVAVAKRCGKGHRVAWADGACWPARKPLQFPAMRDHDVSYDSTQPVAISALGGATTTPLADQGIHVQVESGNPVHLRARMAGTFMLPPEIGGELDWTQQTPWPGSGYAVVIKHLLGVEASGDRAKYFERHFVVSDFSMTWAGLEASVLASEGGLPTPIRVDLDASCRAPLRLTWDRASTTPTLL